MKHLEEVIINYDKKLMKANIEIERLNNCNKKAIRLIRDNYSNPDGEIWHKDIEKILIILEGRDFNEN